MLHRTKKFSRSLILSIVTIIVLSVCLFITTFALTYSMVAVEDNIFATAAVNINLNDGKSVINRSLFEPGATLCEEFFIENESTCDVYYKLYFTNVSGGLADTLIVEIKDDDRVLFSGTPNELTRNRVSAASDALKLNEKRVLKIYFHFPEMSGNDAQGEFLNFDFAADAVQVKNNADKKFD